MLDEQECRASGQEVVSIHDLPADLIVYVVGEVDQRSVIACERGVQPIYPDFQLFDLLTQRPLGLIRLGREV